MSLTHATSGRSVWKSRASRFGATGSEWLESVVGLYFRLLLALIPA
jgi:hypothetical protein